MEKINVRNILLSMIFIVCLAPTSFASTPPVIPGEGLQAEGNKAWQKAISIYLNAILKTPERSDLWLRIAIIEHQLKNYSLAIDAYNHAIQLKPDDPTLYKTVSEIYAELKQSQEAMAAINEAVRLKPNDVNYLLAKANIANWNKQLNIALESDQRILSLTKNTKSSINTLELLTEIGSLQTQLQHYPDAIKTYQQTLQLSPNNPVLYQNLSQTYAAANEPQLALEAIENALKSEPQKSEYLKSKALLATWLKNYTLAMETYQQLLKQSPNDKTTLHDIALVEKLSKIAQQSNIQVALSPFEQLMNQANNDAFHHRYNQAAAAMKKAIDLKPNQADLYKKLSEIYATAKQATLALNAINHALLIQPTELVYLRARAKLASWVKDKAQTFDSYQRILLLKPNDQDALLNFAHTLAWQGKTDLSIQAYEHFLKIYPQSAEGWIQYTEVLTWTARFIDALNALHHYQQLKGETTAYQEIRARILALIGRYQSALTLNEPLLRKQPNNIYLLSTEVVALTRSLNTNKAVDYLKKLVDLATPDDNQVKSLYDITRTPLRSRIDLEGDYTAASDTTKIIDLPVGIQYFLNPTTSLLFQGLYEQATAAPNSGLASVYNNDPISDESVKVGFTKQFDSLNIKGLVGGLKIQNENNHGIYDALLNKNVGETAQLTLENLHDLYRPYLVPQTPKLISLQIMETRIAGAFQWQPLPQKYLNLVMSYSDLTDNNSYLHFNVWPKSRIYGSEHWLLTMGVDGDFWRYKRRPQDGYYSPLRFNGYEGTLELYYAQSKNIGLSASAGFGLQKDETYPHYFYEEDLAMQLFMGIFTDWELQIRGGFTLRDNPIHNYHCSTGAIILTRRF